MLIIGIVSLVSININATEYNINYITKEICFDVHSQVIYRVCSSMPHICGRGWPFGMEYITIDYFQPICQLYELTLNGWMPVGQPYEKALLYTVSERWFVGCGCIPDGDPPYPYNVGMLASQDMPETIK